MDAYVLGTHEGDLPTHLVQEGEEGHRVRAMARLNGPEHNVVYAIEAPDEESALLHIERVGDLGTVINRQIFRCISETCLGLIQAEPRPFIVVGPHRMPPFAYYVFHWLEQEHIREEVAALLDLLGQDGVAAATDGQGHFLVEVGSNDADQISAAAALLSGTGHAVDGEIHRAG